MKYAAVALALAGAAIAEEAAESTVFSTRFFTVTSCAESISNCPARSTVVSSEVVSSVVPVITTPAVPMTTSTIYETRVHTVVSCAADVTDCPSRSTVVVTETKAVSTTVCPVTETGVKPSATSPVAPPAHTSKSEAVPPAPVPTTEAATKPVPATTGGVVPSVSKPATLISSPAAPVCPGVSVKTISTSVTTVIPTVIYETISVPCETASSKPSATIPGVPTGGNGTAVPPTKTPITAGASGLSGSVVLAAIAGVAAYAFA
ncbi:GPI anchored serine-rich protein [Colletotrichum musicola]|uniref:GPI anchored serine-rich protein n=1 Tax=Colletotrichum musicola TaxID=2175873 RepID=A0A8H6IV30_9PEZI|nr:GPI anchored serine-rich protein [Colletotrichum musicola]